ncbi:hypothetical protein HK098_006044 [Nowakowskiella sp. JEL0407]|nr:hypothetical protein HK098_006044 [Nowakowskiella sp. JEL0407]
MIPSQNFPTGLTLSKIIYGLWRVKDSADSSPAGVLKVIKKCLELGITSFDLADIYGGGGHECEKVFGAALALEPSLRSQMQIITKCGIRLPGKEGVVVGHYDTSQSHIERRVNESLEAVGITKFDVVLIHRPDPLMNADEVAKAMIALKSAGKVDYFGVSNFLPHQFTLLQSRCPFKLVTNQIEVNVLNFEAMHDGTLDQCQELNIPAMVWSPLAGGRIFDSNSSNDQIKRVQQTLKDLALKKNAEVDQVAIAWILRHPVAMFPILGTKNIERVLSQSKALDIELTTEEWFSVWVASKGHGVP